jgi:DNA-binding response OmpR family regulator
METTLNQNLVLESLDPPRILVLEDEASLRTILTRMLTQIDSRSEVDWAITAERAISLIENRAKAGKPYDLIVADIRLPGEQSGLDLWFRCQIAFPELMFLFTSGMPVDQFLRSLGKDDICPPYLCKPFSVGECKQVIEGLLAYRLPKPQAA